jgi:hypothetical protein
MPIRAGCGPQPLISLEREQCFRYLDVTLPGARLHMKAVLRRLALAAVLAASVHAQAPTAPVPTVVITGRVVADSTGDPIRNARVSLFPETPPAAIVTTDANGRFSFVAPAGRYRMQAAKTGFARGDATTAASGAPLEVRLKKGAAISGTILDEAGDPVIGVQVAALTSTASQARDTTLATGYTDDRGEYRLAGLPDGRFAVAVTTTGAVNISRIEMAATPQPRTTYYPAAIARGDASEVTLQTGEDRQAIDIVVPADQLSGMPAAIYATRFVRPRQTPALPGTSTVRGRVSGTDGAPIQAARVFLFASQNENSKTTMTDQDGQFVLEKVAPGAFLISVVKAGYTQLESRQPVTPFIMNRGSSWLTPEKAKSGRVIDVAGDEIKDRVDVQMARWGTISGTVTDEYGDPIQGVEVEALQIGYRAGRRLLTHATSIPPIRGNVSATSSRLTDDLGRYRLYDLPPGQYIVSAAVGHVSSEDVPGYGRSYFPGTPNAADAQFVTVGVMQDVVVGDLALSKAPTVRVAGTVHDPSGKPETTPGSLTLAPSQHSSSVIDVAVGARIDADGTFVFPNVAPGQYVIQTYRNRLPVYPGGEFGALTVSVGGSDVTGLTVQTFPGSSVAGRIRFDNAPDPAAMPKPSDVEVAAIPADPDLSPANPSRTDVRAGWTFELEGLNGPHRLQVVRAPSGWTLKEIRVNGIDVTDKPMTFGTRDQSLANVEVVMTNRGTALSGTITDDRGQPAPGATLVVFSTDRGAWYDASRYLRKGVAGADGSFRVAGLPAGSYYASAVAQMPAGGEDAWQDPQFLESLMAGASTVSVAEGQTPALALQLRAQ